MPSSEAELLPPGLAFDEFFRGYRSELLQSGALLTKLGTGVRILLSDLIIHIWRAQQPKIHLRPGRPQPLRDEFLRRLSPRSKPPGRALLTSSIMDELADGARAALRGVGVEEAEITSFENHLSTPTHGLLLYGSRARGDFLAHSDFDVLRLAPVAFHTFNVGRLSVSTYTVEQLASASGTLFGTHLVRDGRILYDSRGELAEILERIEPAAPKTLLETVHRYSMILELPAAERAEHVPGLVRLARYLLRTAVYAVAMQQGKPCFSVRELADRFGDPDLATLLASDPALLPPPTETLLDELSTRLVAIVGPLPHNRFGSLAATATGMWDTDRNLAALAIRAGSEDDDADSLDYSDLPKVLL